MSTTKPDQVTIRSFGKVNLILDVLRLREDGFHEILSLLQTVSFWDRITLRMATGDDISIECEHPEVPLDERNLCFKAARLLLDRTRVGAGVSISILKRIPVGGGLGGGSSNAASVLLGLNRLLDLGVRGDELEEISAQVGSDVPFFLKGGTCIVRGRGEKVEQLPGLNGLAFLLVPFQFQVSSAWAYERWDQLPPRELTDHSHWDTLVTSALERADANALPPLLRNSLEDGVFQDHPELREAMERMQAISCPACVMTGSGPSLLGVFYDLNGATEAAERLWRLGYRSICTEPVPAGSSILPLT